MGEKGPRVRSAHVARARNDVVLNFFVPSPRAARKAEAFEGWTLPSGVGKRGGFRLLILAPQFARE